MSGQTTTGSAKNNPKYQVPDLVFNLHNVDRDIRNDQWANRACKRIISRDRKPIRKIRRTAVRVAELAVRTDDAKRALEHKKYVRPLIDLTKTGASIVGASAMAMVYIKALKNSEKVAKIVFIKLVKDNLNLISEEKAEEVVEKLMKRYSENCYVNGLFKNEYKGGSYIDGLFKYVKDLFCSHEKVNATLKLQGRNKNSFTDREFETLYFKEYQVHKGMWSSMSLEQNKVRYIVYKAIRDANPDAWNTYVALEDEEDLACSKWNIYSKETLHDRDAKLRGQFKQYSLFDWKPDLINR